MIMLSRPIVMNIEYLKNMYRVFCLERYDYSNWQDVYHIWSQLHNDDTFSLQCCTLVILDCQYEYETELIYDDFFDYSEEEIRK